MVVLIVDSDPREIQSVAALCREQGHLPLITDSLKSAAALLQKESPGLVLLHLNAPMPQVLAFIESAQLLEPQPAPVIVTTLRPRLEDAVELMKHGAQDFWTKPVNLERLSKTIEWIESRQKRQVSSDASPVAIITANPAMIRLKAMAKKVAASNATVFVQGESGTGKELFARYIHRESPRRDKPFVALNCAALPETLLEGELFGHEKGAFTGAIKAKEGKFELAHTGSLLLDEVTEIPVHLQAKLLRVLQEGEVDRLGGRHPIPIDARVIATTNLTMETALKEGRFRKDLYYRLNVIPLRIPPLRDRPEDIALLSQHLAERYAQLHGTPAVELAPETLHVLQDYPWPGNVRELQNVIQRAVLLTSGPCLTPECLIFDEEGSAAPRESIALMPLNEMEKRMIHKALATVDGNRTRAAEILGISVRTLRNKLNEYRQEQAV